MVKDRAIDGQTAEQFLTELFEFQLCEECAGDAADHTASLDMFDKWHAWCAYKTPEGTKIKIELLRSDGAWWSYSIKLRDSDEDMVPLATEYVTFEHPGFNNLSVEGEYTGAMDVDSDCDSLQEAAIKVLRDYRLKKHNEQ